MDDNNESDDEDEPPALTKPSKVLEICAHMERLETHTCCWGEQGNTNQERAQQANNKIVV